MIERLKLVTEEEIAKLALPMNHAVNVFPYAHKKIYDKTPTQEKFYVDVALGYSGNPLEDANCSVLGFCHNNSLKILQEINLNINRQLRGKGYGSKLAKGLEEIAKALGCDLILFNLVTIDGKKFWPKMGYEQIPNGYWGKVVGNC